MKARNGMRILSLVLIIVAFTIARPNAAAAMLPYLELNRPDRGRVFAVAWSPDGKYIAVGTERGLWLYTATFRDVLYNLDKPIRALAWSPDGQSIATGYFGEEPTSTHPQNGDDSFLPIIEGGGFRLWSIQKIGNRFKLTSLPKLLSDGAVYALRFNPNGSRLAVLFQDGYQAGDDVWGRDRLHIYAISTGQLLFDKVTERLELLQDKRTTLSANGLSWTADGQHLGVIRVLNNDSSARLSIVGLTQTSQRAAQMINSRDE